jgi:tetratricopeptide (TPR) repeat protein
LELRSITLLLPLLLVSTAQACLNDRDSDSLAQQAKKLPDTLRVISGRFERNPPLYYEMRIRRSLAALKVNPRRFDLYDDVAVAYDRLHKDDEALRVMAVKRSLLPEFNARDAQVKEDWYRYYANAGTFYAHRWLGAGARKADIGEMKKARDYIRRAVQIKPKAHFGREKFQLMTMEWIIATRERKGGIGKTLGEWIGSKEGWEFNDESDGMAPATEGLAGLMVLGAAWRSPDIFEALAASLERREAVTLRYMALQRCWELLVGGQKSFEPKKLNLNAVDSIARQSMYGDFTGVAVNQQNRKTLQKLFLELRAESEVWLGHRNAYMLANLKKGRHPDTDDNFWRGWKSPAPPTLDVPWWNAKRGNYGDEGVVSRKEPLVACLLFFGFVCALFYVRLIQKQGWHP